MNSTEIICRLIDALKSNTYGYEYLIELAKEVIANDTESSYFIEIDNENYEIDRFDTDDTGFDVIHTVNGDVFIIGTESSFEEAVRNKLENLSTYKLRNLLSYEELAELWLNDTSFSEYCDNMVEDYRTFFDFGTECDITECSSRLEEKLGYVPEYAYVA